MSLLKAEWLACVLDLKPMLGILYKDVISEDQISDLMACTFTSKK